MSQGIKVMLEEPTEKGDLSSCELLDFRLTAYGAYMGST